MTVTTFAPVASPKQSTTANTKTMTVIEPMKVQYPAKVSTDQFEVQSQCLFDDVDDAVRECVAAQQIFQAMKLAQRKTIIQSIRETCTRFVEDFAYCAYCETGRGRYQDKVTKQRLAIRETPGPEDLVPRTTTGDNGMTTVDFAPFGVMGAVTPVTNPTATVINNCITLLSGGNGVVFNPHPAAKVCTNRAIAVVSMAIQRAGGPQAIVASVREPTIQSGSRLMTHPMTAANLITGGPAVVKVALQSGKRSFCAGPGNPPVVVDETADLDIAASRILDGASFDNNMICSDEKEVFAVASIADQLITKMRNLGAYQLDDDQVNRLLPQIFINEPKNGEHGQMNAKLVGSDASDLAQLVGVNVDKEECRLLIAKVGPDHPLIWTEQLMPVLPICAVPDFPTAVGMAKKVEYNYKHTSSIYSQNLERITKMAQIMNTSIFVVNGSNTAGLAADGEGYTSFSIAGTTGEGMTRPSTFVRERRLVCCNALRFV